MNNLTNRKGTQNNLQELSINNNKISGVELANAMSQHFINVRVPDKPQMTNSCNDRVPGPCVSGSIMQSPTTPSEVQKQIMGLQNNVAAGLDNIRVVPIKKASCTISEILSNIINNMFATGIFPDDLKVARVNPVYKGGGENHLKSYRPISVLSVFSKIVKGVLNNRQVNFINKYNVITALQCGFQEGKSTELALTYIRIQS